MRHLPAVEHFFCRRCGVDVECGHRPGCPREDRVKACGCVGVPGEPAYDIHQDSA